MDPEVTLAEMRACLTVLAERDDLDDTVQCLVDRVEALDGWLSNGGFLPTDWRP